MRKLPAYHVVERLTDWSLAAVIGLADGIGWFKQLLGLHPNPRPTHPRTARGFTCIRDQSPNEAHRG